MSVLIKGMDMPQSCDDCLLTNGITCYAVPDYREDGVVGRTDDRPNWCPLAPAADVRLVVRGKWEDVEVTYVADKTTLPFERISSMRCNQCNRYHTEIFYYGNPTEMARFCPNCGAYMREE